MNPETIRIEYLGRGPKKVELPIPFVQKCEKTSEVICNPIGEFPYEDGMRLLEIAGEGGLFRAADGKPADKPAETKSEAAPPPAEPEYYEHTCACGCEGKIEKKPAHKYNGIPKYLKAHAGKKRTAPSPE